MRQQSDDDAPGLLSWRDALVYFGPTCVPLAMALSGRMSMFRRVAMTEFWARGGCNGIAEGMP